MTNDELKIKIGELLPSATFDEPADPKSAWLTIHISPADWPSLAKQLRETDALTFDYLFCLTCIDWKTHLTMVYHLSSTIYRHTIVVKSKLDLIKPADRNMFQDLEDGRIP